jgi:hypothetical protein
VATGTLATFPVFSTKTTLAVAGAAAAETLCFSTSLPASASSALKGQSVTSTLTFAATSAGEAVQGWAAAPIKSTFVQTASIVTHRQVTSIRCWAGSQGVTISWRSNDPNATFNVYDGRDGSLILQGIAATRVTIPLSQTRYPYSIRVTTASSVTGWESNFVSVTVRNRDGEPECA